MVLLLLFIGISVVLALRLVNREPQETGVEPGPDSPPAQRRSRWQQTYRRLSSNDRLVLPDEEFDFGSLISSVVSDVTSPPARDQPLWQPDYRYFSSNERLVLSPEQLSPRAILSPGLVTNYAEARSGGQETDDEVGRGLYLPVASVDDDLV